MNTTKAAKFFANTLTVLILATPSLKALEVKSTKGQAMDIEVLAYTKSSGNVRIKRISDGAIFNTSLDLFDSESQAKIVESAPKAKAKLDTKVTVGRRRKKVADSSFAETQTLSTKITIENESRDVDFLNGKGTIYLVTRSTKRFANRNSDKRRILLKETFDVNLNSGQIFNFEAKPAITQYDSDKDSSNLGGQEYYGWLFILQDEDDTMYLLKTSIGNLKKEMEENPDLGESLLELNVGDWVKENLEKR